MPLHDAEQDLSDDIRLAAPEERLKMGGFSTGLSRLTRGSSRPKSAASGSRSRRRWIDWRPKQTGRAGSR